MKIAPKLTPVYDTTGKYIGNLLVEMKSPNGFCRVVINDTIVGRAAILDGALLCMDVEAVFWAMYSPRVASNLIDALKALSSDGALSSAKARVDRKPSTISALFREGGPLIPTQTRFNRFKTRYAKTIGLDPAKGPDRSVTWPIDG